MLVAGIVDLEYNLAVKRVEEAGKDLGGDLKILGRLSSGKGKEILEDGESELFTLDFRKGLGPTIIADQDCQTIPQVLFYSPLRRLEMLSLQPMPLNFSTCGQDSVPSLQSTVLSRNKSTIPGCNQSKMGQIVDWVSLDVLRVGIGVADLSLLGPRILRSISVLMQSDESHWRSPHNGQLEQGLDFTALRPIFLKLDSPSILRFSRFVYR